MLKKVIMMVLVVATISSQVSAMEFVGPAAGSALNAKIIPVPGTNQSVSLAQTALVGLASWVGYKLAPEKQKNIVRNTLVGGGFFLGLWALVSNRTAIINKIGEVQSTVNAIQQTMANQHRINQEAINGVGVRVDGVNANVVEHQRLNMEAHARTNAQLGDVRAQQVADASLAMQREATNRRIQTYQFLLGLASLQQGKNIAADVANIRTDVSTMRDHMGALTKITAANGTNVIAARTDIAGVRGDITRLGDHLSREIRAAKA